MIIAYPKYLNSDSGKESTNSEMATLCKEYRIIHLRGRQSQGQIERLTQTLNRKLSKLIFGKPYLWINYISPVNTDYNSLKHSATGMTPLEYSEEETALNRRPLKTFGKFGN